MIQKDELSCQYFVAVEQAIPVNGPQVRGAALWPFVRNMLYPVLAHEILPQAADSTHTRIAERYNDTLLQRGLPHPSGTVESTSPPAGTGPATAGDVGPVLFFTRPVEHSSTATEGFYAPILDPWIDLALETGPVVKLEALENASLARQPRYHPTLFMSWPEQAQFDASRPAFHQEAMPPLRELVLSLAEFSRTAFGIDIAPAFPRIAGDFLACMTFRMLLDRQFDLLSPRALALVCYYYSVGMAATWAARARGLPVLELQHGSNGDFHPAYSHWTAVPEGGYDLMPDVFVTWSELSSDNVRRWMPRSGHPHRTLAGGRPGLLTEPQHDSLALAARQTYQSVRQGFRKVILLTLGRESMAPFFTDLIAAAPRDWFWAIRAHPLASETEAPGSTPAGIHAALAERGLTNAEAEIASRAFLSTMLAYSDHHVSRQSSSCLEAAALDLPTSFIASQARSIHAAMLERRQAYYVETAAGLIASVEAGWQGLDRTGPPHIVADQAQARAALSAALTPVSGRRAPRKAVV